MIGGSVVAHKEKYTKGAVGHMFAHYERSKYVPSLKSPVNTELNYNLAEIDQPMEQLDFLHKRLSEVKVHKRKDINVMVDWIITIPQSLNDKSLKDKERFFEEAYKFLNDRYGKENVISAYVHMDEVTPHMHYAFVPVVEDKKKGGYKLSAKEAVTREDLRTFHQDLSKHMEYVFGYDIGILNEVTKEGNRSIAELKRETALEGLKKLNLEVTVLEKQKRALKEEIEGLQGNIKATKSIVDAMRSDSISIPIRQLRAVAIDGLYAKLAVNTYKEENIRLEELVLSLRRCLETGVQSIFEEHQEFKKEKQEFKNKIMWVVNSLSSGSRAEFQRNLRRYDFEKSQQNQKQEEVKQEKQENLPSIGIGFDR